MFAGLTAENADFLRDQVAAGEFGNDSEAMNAAVALLRRRAALKAKLRRSAEQLENGDYIDLDDEGLDRFFDELFTKAGGEGRLD
jgi:Arc/MetJ-type ribon-helix-helix transcriptional regulator